ncbi:hypothetical protein LTS14_010646 [Recurvomyces mirabilis]|uniref:uncharacterized protein n=1 Tax=Recurvomyces mirabilis TaxID=574656 RepID=UPI002DE1B1B9|nr:hypothetical protein LTS14_010646 [Recurvomyces mirabilis]
MAARCLWTVAFGVPAAARVLWVPATFDPNERRSLGGNNLFSRDNSVSSCGASYPSDFTCPSSTQCLALNTTSTKAVLCCPAGQDCQIINPVNCDQSLQNATLVPNSQLHANPTLSLTTASTSATATRSTTTSSASTPTTSNGASATAIPGEAVDGGATSSSSNFSGGSFAAGFVPGVFLGALLIACLLFILLRRKKRTTNAYYNEKQSPRDTLTDLTTLSHRPTMHGRSISEPTPDPAAARTDFLRGTPPRVPDGTNSENGYSVNIFGPTSAPRTPARTPMAAKALFSRSPFMNQTPATPLSTQPPLPAHLKRGTLSFSISPVRALRKQKSSYSLRRHMTDASRGSDRRMTRNNSTETIQVLMPNNEPYTPDQRPPQIQLPATLGSSVYKPQKVYTSAAESWRLSHAADLEDAGPAPYAPSASTYLDYTSMKDRGFTNNSESNVGRKLGTPYTPSKYTGLGNNGTATGASSSANSPLGASGRADKRVTTFSALMEKAGLNKGEWLPEHSSRK